MSEQPSIDLRKRWEPVVPFDRSFDPSDGLECLAHDPDAGEIRGRFAVGETVLSEHGLVHGGDAWLWTVDARHDEGRPCAHSRVTVAVRPLRGPAG